MLALLLKRQARERAARPDAVPVSAQTTGTEEAPVHQAWDGMQQSLKTDLSYLRTLAGSQEKNPYKAALLKKYQPQVESLMRTHANLSGLDVVWWFYQWQIDCGRLTDIHDEFRAALDKGLETPHNWHSNAQTAYCDIVFKYSHAATADKTPCERRYLMAAVSDVISGRLATNAPLKVKMFRLVGDWHEEEGNTQEALKLFERVMSIDPHKGGRKAKLKALKEALANGKTH